ncbi:hypothetical protein [Salisediminibacterium selenitireducens]|uniref:hypothetical protein n=1 Tax=Salisediminibacterium selenitireducens TaxID=85683 RepID=UPI000311B2EA|nr:hypothetical protein [Salisediminibacterium selenitireducens]
MDIEKIRNAIPDLGEGFTAQASLEWNERKAQSNSLLNMKNPHRLARVLLLAVFDQVSVLFIITRQEDSM